MAWFERQSWAPEQGLRFTAAHEGGKHGRWHVQARDDRDVVVHSAFYDWNVWEGHCSGHLLKDGFIRAALAKLAAQPEPPEEGIMTVEELNAVARAFRRFGIRVNPQMLKAVDELVSEARAAQSKPAEPSAIEQAYESMLGRPVTLPPADPPGEWTAHGLTKAEWDRYLQLRKDFESRPAEPSAGALPERAKLIERMTTILRSWAISSPQHDAPYWTNGMFAHDCRDMADTLASIQARAPQAEPVLPMPGSPEASAMMDSLLAEYHYPSNPKNAARAGYEAARRMLAALPSHPQDAAPEGKA